MFRILRKFHACFLPRKLILRLRIVFHSDPRANTSHCNTFLFRSRRWTRVLVHFPRSKQSSYMRVAFTVNYRWIIIHVRWYLLRSEYIFTVQDEFGKYYRLMTDSNDFAIPKLLGIMWRSKRWFSTLSTDGNVRTMKFFNFHYCDHCTLQCLEKYKYKRS